MRLSPSRLALGLALPLVLATASLAEPVPSAAPPAGHAGPGGPMRDPAARAEAHARRLREVLQLRPEQEPALQAFIASHQRPEGMRERMRQERQGADALTTPQRLDRMLAHLDEARARMAARAEAVKRFYGQLTAPQQRAFDALHAGHGGMGMRHRHGGMGGHDGGPRMHGPDMQGPGVDGGDIDDPMEP